MKRTETTPAPSTTALSGAAACGAEASGATAPGTEAPGTEAGAPGPATVDVIVVGAGVSGCACAAALAVGGARVMVVSSALDVVGLPGHGPAVAPASGQWREIVQVLSSLPEALRSAWLNAASIPDDGTPLLIVDRRAVSIETKRALELIPGLQFRQGLVTDVRVVGSPEREGPVGVEIETVFGEILAAPLVVLATGLAMGGVMRIGEQEMAGGQYGEVPATALEAALREAGVSFRETEVSVGARYGADSRFVTEALAAAGEQRLVAHAVPIRSLLRGSAGAAAEEAGEPLRTIVRCFADCMAGVDDNGTGGTMAGRVSAVASLDRIVRARGGRVLRGYPHLPKGDCGLTARCCRSRRRSGGADGTVHRIGSRDGAPPRTGATPRWGGDSGILRGASCRARHRLRYGPG